MCPPDHIKCTLCHIECGACKMNTHHVLFVCPAALDRLGGSFKETCYTFVQRLLKVLC
jgi:hypothetical protein